MSATWDDRDDDDDFEEERENKGGRLYQKTQNRPKPKGCSSVFYIAFIGVALAGIIWMLVGVFQDYQKYLLLTREGVPTPGIITNKGVEIHRRPGWHRPSTYYVVYEYTAPVQGKFTKFEIKRRISSFVYSNYKIGQKVEVIYAVASPDVSDIKKELGPPSAWGILFFLGLGVFIIYIGLKQLLG